MNRSILSLISAYILLCTPALLSIDLCRSQDNQSCTSIMVGKDASTDGSVMTSHTCDSNYRTWVDIVSGKRFQPGAKDQIKWGTMHTEEPWDTRGVEIKGEIPAYDSTFAYLNTAYPCLNEKQLAIGETTITGRKELLNREGLFVIEELERVALQRCSTAIDAIRLMGSLAEEYGYGDWGECLTVADKNEVWQFEIFGSGNRGKASAIWVAQRIPDDHVGISANIPRISKVDFNDPANFLHSKDIKKRCKALGLWDGVSDFIFWKINNGEKPFSIREYFVFSTLAPSMELSYDSEELPFSIKPDKRVSPSELIAFFRETYEGTEWDQTKNLFGVIDKRGTNGVTISDTIRPISNFMSNDMRIMLNNIKPDITKRIRGIAVIQCSYSHVIQLRNWLPDEVGGVAYFSFDNPAQSPRIPIYCGNITLPKEFKICGQHRYRPESAVWAFRETNRIATIYWGKTRGKIEPYISSFEKAMINNATDIEKRAESLVKQGKKAEAKELLTKYTEEFALSAIARWREIKTELWTIFARSM